MDKIMKLNWYCVHRVIHSLVSWLSDCSVAEILRSLVQIRLVGTNFRFSELCFYFDLKRDNHNSVLIFGLFLVFLNLFWKSLTAVTSTERHSQQQSGRKK
ncbi:hypothetical protein L596_000535 [Steinernema carpocapsae]|uniref:Uncharacterized protein n=1 Tax=Steinernema carpocapsae TaxID=34508 RepID=A0A4U8UID3_STECR|nr:hypothetical protein L596_000535 [Steinernema carpocapsae]